RLFTPEGLAFVRQITDDIQRVDPVERVYSLSTANIVANLPATADDDGGIEVQPLLEKVIDQQVASRVRARVLSDPLLRGDVASEDGTVTALIVTFDEDRIDQARAEVIDRIHGLNDPRLPD